MSSPAGRTVLVLGGIGSGRSRYAESLLAGAGNVRRLTGPAGADPSGLARALTEAKPDETLLVDGLDDWLSGTDAGAAPAAAALVADAVRDSTARLVLVSSEVGLSVPGAGGPDTAEAIGALNHAVADAADEVVLVVAGQPVRLRGPGGGDRGEVQPAAATVSPAAAIAPAVSAGTVVETATVLDEARLKALPLPDEQAREAAAARLTGAGLGALAAVVSFAAGAQGNPHPAPWHRARVFALRVDHAGGAATGAAGSAARAAALREGAGPLAQLAGAAGTAVQVVENDPAAAIEQGPAMTDAAAEQALATGWRLAEQAVDEGVDLLVLASIGDGAETAAAAVASALGGQAAEPAALLARVPAPDGTIDDAAWISRCAALRDSLHRARSAGRTRAPTVLAELGGADIAVAAGLILGAAARRTPVALDGPVGAAGALVARQLAAASRRWCLLSDHGGHPTVVRAAAVLSLTPLLDLKLALGEGVATLAALPLLRSALTLAAAEHSGPSEPAS